MEANMNNDMVAITSGESEIGTIEFVTGKTDKQIKTILKKERCDGDRWAKAVRYSHTNKWGHVGVDVETGEYDIFPDYKNGGEI